MNESDVHKFVSLYNKADELINEIWPLYNEAKYYRKSGSQIPSTNSELIEWWIDDQNNIGVKWSESWAYGGYEEDYDSFPIEFLYNEQALKDYRKSKGLQ